MKCKKCEHELKNCCILNCQFCIKSGMYCYICNIHRGIDLDFDSIYDVNEVILNMDSHDLRHLIGLVLDELFSKKSNVYEDEKSKKLKVRDQTQYEIAKKLKKIELEWVETEKKTLKEKYHK